MISSKSYQKKFSSGVIQSLLMVSGNIVAQCIAAVSLIVITRQLGPVAFGEFSVAFAILIILTKINDFGLTTVLHKFAAQEKSVSRVNAIFSYTIKLKLIGVSIIWITGLIVYQKLAIVLHITNQNLILAAFLLSSATVLYEQLQAMLQSIHSFSNSVIINIFQASVKLLAVYLLFLILVKNSLYPFILYTAAPIIPVICSLYFLPKWFHVFHSRFPAIPKAQIRNVAFHAAVGIISIGIIENSDVLFVQRYLTSYETGLLGGVSRIALLFNLISYSLATVLNPRVARYTQQRDLQKYLLKAWLVSVLCIVGFLIYIPFSQLVIDVTIGHEYIQGTGILNILIAAACISIATVPFTAVFFSFDKPWYFSLSGLAQLIIIVFGNYYFIPLYGIAAAAWIKLIAKLAVLVVTAYISMYLVHSKKKY